MKISEWRLKIAAVNEALLSRLKGAADKVADSFGAAQKKSKDLGASVNPLNANLDRLSPKINKAFDSKEIKRFNTEVKQTERHLAKIENMPSGGFLQKIRSAVPSFGMLGRTIAAAFSLYAVTNFTQGVMASTMQAEALKNQLDFINGGPAAGAKDLNWLKATSDQMGLNLLSSSKGYLLLSGATRGTELAGEATKKIFKGISTAAAGMNLTADQSEGAILALGQMLSKGKVSAEELTGQLGERIPGALGIASRAMGMSTSQLYEMMAAGKLLSKDFVPRFAAQLVKELGPAASKFATSMAAEMNRAQNAIESLKVEIGNELRPIIIDLLKYTVQFVKAMKEKFHWLKENKDIVLGYAKAFGALFVAFKAFKVFNEFQLALGLVNGGLGGTFGAYSRLYNFVKNNPLKVGAGGILLAVGMVAEHMWSNHVEQSNNLAAHQKAKQLNPNDAAGSENSLVSFFSNYVGNGKGRKTMEGAESSAISKLNADLLAVQNKLSKLITTGDASGEEALGLQRRKAFINLQLSQLGDPKTLNRIKASAEAFVKTGKFKKADDTNTSTDPFTSEMDKANQDIHGGGHQVKNITVHMNIPKDLINIHVKHLRESGHEISTIITDLILKGTQGAEIALSNG